MVTRTVLALGFRTFYLLAGLLAVVGMLLWLLSYTGHAQFGTYLQGMFWHSHEMFFGFVSSKYRYHFAVVR